MAARERDALKPRGRLPGGDKLDAVMRAISTYDIKTSPAWRALEALSAGVEVEDVEAVPEGIFETDRGFSAAATVYVSVGPGEEASSTDSLSAQVEGHFEQSATETKAIVDTFSVDTTSFYE
jgi:hypothetical protein